ncbi:MAG: hypothetical protein HUU22_19155 [Phycisphaerae bacterium]|nr:hypothetical protein [Phycisphaerae bacterium]NUQ48137.1 hypothetical protein [Phycisphaerae bacterium]
MAKQPPNGTKNRKVSESELRAFKLNLIGIAIRRGCDLIGYAIIGWTIYACVAQIAGKTTAFQLAFEALADLKASEYFAWALVLLFGSTTLALHRSRKNIIARYHPYRKMFEEQHDPNRGTSGLTLQGDSSPEDRLP